MEHRWGERTSIARTVRLSSLPCAIGAGRFRDVSMSGAFVETRLLVPLLACVHIEFDLPSRPDKRYSIPGYVMRQDENGIGIEWIELAPFAVLELLKAGFSRPLARTSKAQIQTDR